MISLDQVLLLQEKVESAVEKIQQLTSENDALRSKCAELTKALSEKTELVSTLENTQNKIETGILSALNRLDAVENSILDGHDGLNQEPVLRTDSIPSNNNPIEKSYTAQEPSDFTPVIEEDSASEEYQETAVNEEISIPVQQEKTLEEENNQDSLGQFDIY